MKTKNHLRHLEDLLSQKQFNSLLDHLERIKNDVTLLKQKSAGETYLVDTYELVRILHVTYRTIERWRINGRLPYIRLGRRYYYRIDLLIDRFRAFPNQPVENGVSQPGDQNTGDENFGMLCDKCPFFKLMIS